MNMDKDLKEAITKLIDDHLENSKCIHSEWGTDYYNQWRNIIMYKDAGDDRDFTVDDDGNIKVVIPDGPKAILYPAITPFKRVP